MKHGKVTMDRAFDALMERNALPDVFHLREGFTSAVFGGPVDRDDGREYGDVHYVQLAVHDLKVMLADLIEEEG